MLITTAIRDTNGYKMWSIWDTSDAHDVKLMRNWIRLNSVSLNYIKCHNGDYFIFLK